MLTVEEYLRRSADPKWYGEQDENGVDLSTLYRNLALSPTERLRRGDQATTDALRIRQHARRTEPDTA